MNIDENIALKTENNSTKNQIHQWKKRFNTRK